VIRIRCMNATVMALGIDWIDNISSQIAPLMET
jgi:hypothetical protein